MRDLSRFMERVGATDSTVAQATGIDPATIWRIRQGVSSRPRLDTVEALVEWARAAAEERRIPQRERLEVLPGLVA